jgi:hypothetical protein
MTPSDAFARPSLPQSDNASHNNNTADGVQSEQQSQTAASRYILHFPTDGKYTFAPRTEGPDRTGQRIEYPPPSEAHETLAQDFAEGIRALAPFVDLDELKSKVDSYVSNYPDEDLEVVSILNVKGVPSVIFDVVGVVCN